MKQVTDTPAGPIPKTGKAMSTTKPAKGGSPLVTPGLKTPLKSGGQPKAGKSGVVTGAKIR